jgi:hypothetical protein
MIKVNAHNHILKHGGLERPTPPQRASQKLAIENEKGAQ